VDSARQIFDWLDDCMRNHPNCRKGKLKATEMHENLSSEHYMPKRILEISGHQLILREHLTTKRQYACLSHSWGPNGVPFQLKTSTLGALKQGISISALPKTFRDAVLTCMRLGIRLIWIDALCKFSIGYSLLSPPTRRRDSLEYFKSDWRVLGNQVKF
jgi:hypothetical protein